MSETDEKSEPKRTGDIFGRTGPGEYRTWVRPDHNYCALGAGVPGASLSEYRQVVEYLEASRGTIETVIADIGYESWRLSRWTSLSSSINPGALTATVHCNGTRVPAARCTGPLDNNAAPRSFEEASISVYPVTRYMLSAAWSVDEIRGAMFASDPLDVIPLEAAVMGTLEAGETALLIGDDGSSGLCNQPGMKMTRYGNGEDNGRAEANSIRSKIDVEVQSLMDDAKPIIGKRPRGCTVLLPGAEYDCLKHHLLLYDVEKTGPYTREIELPLVVERIPDLGHMVATFVNSEVSEMPMIPPRIRGIIDRDREIHVEIETLFAPLVVKKPDLVRYFTVRP